MPGRRSKTDLASNPIRVVRKSLGLTIAQLAELAEVHEQALYLNENGCYVDVLPAVERVLQILTDIDARELKASYHDWQRERRHVFGERYGLSDLVLVGREHTSPVASLRLQLTLASMRFAKELAVQPALVYKCERGQARALPEQLGYALIQAGLPRQVVEFMSEKQEEFYFYYGDYCRARDRDSFREEET